MTDPQTIASKLTKAQTDYLRQMSDEAHKWSGTHGWPGFRDSLECRGLIRSTNQSTWERETVPTPLGFSVRTHLEKEPKT